MALDLEASDALPTEAHAEASPDPKEGAQQNAQGAPAGDGTASTSATPDAERSTAASSDDTEDKRARRAAESERDAFRSELESLKAEVAKLKPYAALEDVAKEDPGQWLTELAEAQGITPQRVLEIITKRGAGEEARLTADERVARLEAQLAEDRAERQRERDERKKLEDDTRAAETRKGNVAATADFIKANSKDLPGLDETDAADVFAVVEARYAQMPEYQRPKDQRALQALYLDAAKRVEAAARELTERRASRFGYSKPTTVRTPAANEGFRGLSLDSTTAPAPVADRDRVNTPEEIEAIAQRFLS